jgi:hypothetical protein
MRHELRVDAALAYATRDQLGVLAAAVDDKDRALLRSGLREVDDVRLSDDNSAPLS